MIKKYSIIILAFILSLVLVGCKKTVYKPNMELDNPYAIIKTKIGSKEQKDMVLELYPNKAPITVANFVELATSGFYNGLIFHRVIKDFMIQGGDPSGDGTGGPGYSIKGEFSKNGFPNNTSHEKGVISMARSADPNSAGSQFFICHKKSEHLDGQYAAFGCLLTGFETLDNIANEKTEYNDKPLTKCKIIKIEIVKNAYKPITFNKIGG